MKKKSSVAIIIPVHNEQEAIERVLRQARSACDHAEIIVSDDCSDDDSVVIAQASANVVLTSEQNDGNGSATRRALRYLCEEYEGIPDFVIRIDGDGQHDPSLLPGVVERLEQGSDIVVCSRFSRESDTKSAMSDRIVLNMTAAYWVRMLTGWEVTDARSGFMGFRWPMIRHIVGSLRTERYGIPLEILLRFWHRFPSAVHAEIPHPARYDRGISSKLDAKYYVETMPDKVSRLAQAYQVFLSTYHDLGLDGRILRSGIEELFSAVG